jgi:hypothetical protein
MVLIARVEYQKIKNKKSTCHQGDNMISSCGLDNLHFCRKIGKHSSIDYAVKILITDKMRQITNNVTNLRGNNK